MATPEPLPPQRAGDADRDHAAETVRAAGADGRLEFDEMEHRLDAVLSARTHPELEALLADLHGPTGRAVTQSPQRAVPASRPEAPETRHTVTVMGDNRRRGFWRPAAQSRVTTIMGETELDFRDADLRHPVTELSVFTLMGTTVIEVPEGINVHVTKLTIMGSNRVDVDAEPIPGAPELHIRLVSIMGEGRLVRRGSRRTQLDA